MIKDAVIASFIVYSMSETSRFVRDIHAGGIESGAIRRYSLIGVLKEFGHLPSGSETQTVSFDLKKHREEAEVSAIAARYLLNMWGVIAGNLERELETTQEARAKRFRTPLILPKYVALKKQADGSLKRGVESWFMQNSAHADSREKEVYKRYVTVLNELKDPIFRNPQQHIISGTRTAVNTMIDLMYVSHEMVRRQYSERFDAPLIVRAVIRQLQPFVSALAQVDIGVLEQFRDVLGIDGPEGGESGIQLDRFVIEETFSDTGMAMYELGITPAAKELIVDQYTQDNQAAVSEGAYPSLGCPIMVVPGRDTGGAKDELFNTLYKVVEREILPPVVEK
jgi:hypothetical protein